MEFHAVGIAGDGGVTQQARMGSDVVHAGADGGHELDQACEVQTCEVEPMVEIRCKTAATRQKTET